MKIFMKLLVASFVIATLISVVPFESTCSDLERDVLRLHIIANSDSVADQNLKLMVRDNVQSVISPLYDGIDSKEEALKITKDNLALIEKTTKVTVTDCGYDYDVDVTVSHGFFDTRYYDDFTMPAGMYDTLVITLGEGSGKNWWCVMYPTLCVGACSDISMKDDLSDDEFDVITAKDVVFKFKIVEYFKKISAAFS